METHFKHFYPENETFVDGYIENGREIWYEFPLALRDLQCNHCKLKFGHSSKLNDGSENAHLRVAFCGNAKCPRPRDFQKIDPVKPKIDWSIMGVPADYVGKSFDNFNFSNEEARKDAENFVTSCSRYCWVFRGKVRRGKTHLSVAIAKKWKVSVGLDMMFVTHEQFYFELIASMKEGKQEHVIQKYVNVPLLVLDDLGVLRGTPAENDYTYVLISRRLCKPCKTIITTNRTVEELELQYGARLMARLGEKGAMKTFT